MPTASPEDPESELPPPGTRWGTGAQSVLPYLARSLQARPAQASEPREPQARAGETVFTNTPPTSR